MARPRLISIPGGAITVEVSDIYAIRLKIEHYDFGSAETHLSYESADRLVARLQECMNEID